MSATALVVSSTEVKKEQISKLIDKAKQWALLHGVQMRLQSDPGSTSFVEYAPMTLFPSPIPNTVCREAKDLQTHYNTLMAKISFDHKFLQESLCNVIEVDEFTCKLWDIYTTVRNEGTPQPVTLGLFRNDYMLDVKTSCCDIRGLPACVKLKQIEFNTIASSFAGLSSELWKVHRKTMSNSGVQFTDEQLPENKPSKGLADGLYQAWKYYSNKYHSPSAAVVFIVQKMERNTIDQRLLEDKLYNKDNSIRVCHVTLHDACTRCALTDDKRLVLDGDIEVGVIYFRDGYSPDHYTTEEIWCSRLLMERSLAVKCPSVPLQLAGCKKIQQELARPGALERFIKDTSICEQIRNTFAGQYSLDLGSDGDKNIKLAVQNPKHYVVKPQREGGGNNIYGEDIVPFLNKIMDSKERNAYILMERIFPWPQKNYLLKEGREPVLRDVISEMGIFGVYLGSAESELYNKEVGHLLRTKSSEDDEGGIMAGFATINTPYLVDPPCL